MAGNLETKGIHMTARNSVSGWLTALILMGAVVLITALNL
jgi:hypothetical protein